MAEAGKKADEEHTGQGSLLGGMETSAAPVVLKLKPAEAWTPMEKLQKEFDAVGFFLSGHPLDQYERALAKAGRPSLRRLRNRKRARRDGWPPRRNCHLCAGTPLAEGQQVRVRDVF